MAQPPNRLSRTPPQKPSPRFYLPAAAATAAHSEANSPPNSKGLRTSPRGLSSTQFFVAARTSSVFSGSIGRDKKLNSFLSPLLPFYNEEIKKIYGPGGSATSEGRFKNRSLLLLTN